MKFRLTLFLVFIVQISFSQVKEYKYLGSIILENNIPMSFSLDLFEKNGIVSGYSITNHGTKDETKSEIQGVYFKDDKSFQLQETQIIYTKSEAPINSFCYIRMNLKLKNRFTKKQLEGNFSGNFLDSSECAKGKILLAEKSIIEKKIKKIEKKIEKQIKKDEIIETSILKDGDSLSIKWQAKYITIKIWDSNKEDGDRINLSINKDIILDNYETKNKEKKIKYKLKEGLNKILIEARSLGSSPPNTSRIELIDKKKKYPLLTQLELNKSITIDIHF
tara:strand:+ start:139 stop:969 length:831 start_codon:yes stop_codon:yes gene_type:complete